MPGSSVEAPKKLIVLKSRKMRSEGSASVGKDAPRLRGGGRSAEGRAIGRGEGGGGEAAKQRGSWKLTEAAGLKKRQGKISRGRAEIKDNERGNDDVEVVG